MKQYKLLILNLADDTKKKNDTFNNTNKSIRSILNITVRIKEQ